MSDPLMTAIATTLTSKAIDGLSEAGKAAVQALARLVRRKLGADEASTDVLTRVEAEPAGEADRLVLVRALTRAAADDPVFARELTSCWQELTAAHVVNAPDGVVNSVSGSVEGNLVQARDIHGGLSFGRP
jgi:hypothetical protein